MTPTPPQTAPLSWFEAPARLARLREVAQSWLGTPFFLHGKTKGPAGAVSCQTLVALVYMEAGFVAPGWEIPEAPIEYCFKSMTQTMDGLLAAHFKPVEQTAPGDLICFRMYRQGHLGIAIDDARFVHCLRRDGVSLSRLDDATYLKVAARIWRPVNAM